MDNALLSLSAAAEGGKRPPTSLRIRVSLEVRNSILGDMKLFLNDKNSMDKPKLLEIKSVEKPTDPIYLSPPLQKWPHSISIVSNPIQNNHESHIQTMEQRMQFPVLNSTELLVVYARSDQDKRSNIRKTPTRHHRKQWPYTISITSNPIQPRESMHKEYLTPWARLFDDNVERISRVSYYGGSLKVYLLTDTFRKSYEKFLEKCDQSKVIIHSTSYDTTFVDCELSPDIDNEDKIAFEEKFHVKILFFQKTRKDRQAHSEGNRGSRYRNQESLDGTEKLFSIHGDDPTKMRHGHNNAQVKGLFAPTAPRSMGVVNASAEPRNAQIVDK
ncbi:hypothetical protein ACOME3_002835 [Neoechinorhynchus agilis]